MHNLFLLTFTLVQVKKSIGQGLIGPQAFAILLRVPSEHFTFFGVESKTGENGLASASDWRIQDSNDVRQCGIQNDKA
jgi:hypothetical protein